MRTLEMRLCGEAGAPLATEVMATLLPKRLSMMGLNAKPKVHIKVHGDPATSTHLLIVPTNRVFGLLSSSDSLAALSSYLRHPETKKSFASFNEMLQTLKSWSDKVKGMGADVRDYWVECFKEGEVLPFQVIATKDALGLPKGDAFKYGRFKLHFSELLPKPKGGSSIRRSEDYSYGRLYSITSAFQGHFLGGCGYGSWDTASANILVVHPQDETKRIGALKAHCNRISSLLAPTRVPHPQEELGVCPSPAPSVAGLGQPPAQHAAAACVIAIDCDVSAASDGDAAGLPHLQRRPRPAEWDGGAATAGHKQKRIKEWLQPAPPAQGGTATAVQATVPATQPPHAMPAAQVVAEAAFPSEAVELQSACAADEQLDGEQHDVEMEQLQQAAVDLLLRFVKVDAVKAAACSSVPITEPDINYTLLRSRTSHQDLELLYSLCNGAIYPGALAESAVVVIDHRIRSLEEGVDDEGW